MVSHRVPRGDTSRPLEAAIIFVHCGGRDFPISAREWRKTFSRHNPRLFPVREFAQPLCCFAAVEFQNAPNVSLLLGAKIIDTSLRPRSDRKSPAMQRIHSRHNRAICPCFDPLGKERLLIPNEVPSLGIIKQLMELHSRHLSPFLQDESRNVMD